MSTMSRRFFCFLAVLFVFSAFAAHVYASDQTVFGPEDFKISMWHIHFSINTFSVNDPGEGVLTITKNTQDKNIRGGFLLFNGNLISIRDFLIGEDLVFEKDISLGSNNRLTLFLRGTPDASITMEVRKKSATPPPEVAFLADPESIHSGESSVLTWTTTNADSVSIDQGIGDVPENGSVTVSPTETKTYTITATGPGGTVTDNVTVTVIHPPTVNISANPEIIQVGESFTLTWSSTNADTCAIEPGIGNVDLNGSMEVTPTETITYIITATGPGGTASDSVTVTVNDPAAPPTVSISAVPASIEQGGSSTLSWSSYNAESAHIDNGVGIIPVNGTTTVTPAHTTTYTISVTGPTGSSSARAVVMVTGNPEDQPEGSFGAQYEDLIPPDATVEEYDPRRFSLITGLVQALDGSPISDVSITIHGRPDYGTVKTDAEGRFSIPVEGGGTMTLIYQKDSFITSHRKVYVPWNDNAIAKTIQMISQDTASTTLTFDGNPDTIITHQSTEVIDEFGSRSCSMIFTGDNHAYLVNEEGNDIYELTTITTRASEFTTPESMPAVLPPNSAYTYCVELGVDGAQRVRFEKPIITWVDNFLGFDVGEVVPVGYYDRDRGFWVPSDNGVVVKLLDTNTDGIVDALDTNGDDQPDDLNNDGSFSDEVTGLEDAGRYPPGSTFWRFAVTHFSSWDANWAWDFSPGDEAIFPNPNGLPHVDQKKGEPDTCKSKKISSFIEERSRIFHEDIPIPATDFTLHYTSNRVNGTVKFFV